MKTTFLTLAILVSTIALSKSQPLYMIGNDNELFGIINNKGDIILPMEYEHIQSEYNLIVLKKKGKYGLIDFNNQKFRLECNYDSIIYDCSEYILAKKNFWGIYKKSGEQILNHKYIAVSPFMDIKNSKIAFVKTKEGSFAVDLKGNIAKNIAVDESLFFSHICDLEKDEDLTLATFDERIKQLDGKFGVYVENEDKWIINNNYDRITAIESWYLVKKGDKVGIFNLTGKEIIPPLYEKIVLSENQFIVSKDNKSGIISSNGETIVEPKFKYLKKLNRN